MGNELALYIEIARIGFFKQNTNSGKINCVVLCLMNFAHYNKFLSKVEQPYIDNL